MTKKPQPGTIGWMDLTVTNAEQVKDFYCQVTGWSSSAVSLGDYDDYCVSPKALDGEKESDPVGGICHKRGQNAEMPSQWLMYINVEDLEDSIAKCEQLGGSLITPRRELGSFGTMCVIADPAGAVVALIQPPN